MRIKSLYIKDILSIQETTVNFDDSGLVLLEGWNYDDNKSNGAGKTAIFNALSFGLYGHLPRKISMTEVLRDGAKKGCVVVTVDLDGVEYVIRRERPVNLIVTKDGVDQNMDQSQLETLYKLNYERFLVSMYSAQNEGSKFIKLNDSAKKDFLLGLMDLQKFNDMKKHVDAEIKRINAEKTIREKELASINSKIEVYNDMLHNESSAELSNKISTLETNIEKAKQAIIKLQSVEKPDDSSFVAKEAEIRQQLKVLGDIKTKRAVHHNTWSMLKRQLQSAANVQIDKCPHCDGVLNEAHIPDTGSIEQNIASELEAIAKCDTILQKEQGIKDKLNALQVERAEAFRQYEEATSRIYDLKSFISSTSIDRLRDRLTELQSINAKVAELTAKRVQNMADLLVIGKQLSIQETLSHMYSSTGAPAYIMDSIVDSFNEAVSKYVDMAWNSATYALKTYKENAKGEITTKFSETLTINGETKSVGSRSGGEQKLLSLCIDFAVIDVLSKNFSINLNPIILDEPFEHLDSATREIMMEMLEQLAESRQIWIVDHTTEFKAMFSHTVRVEKRNKISSVVVQ